MQIECPPLRAKKARYFEDRRFADRVLPLPQPGRTPGAAAPDKWPSLPLRPSAQTPTTDVHQDEDTANSGLRREPDLPEHVAIASEATALPPASGFDVVDDTDDSVAVQARTLSKQMRGIARQAARYEGLVKALGQRLQKGPSILNEIPQDVENEPSHSARDDALGGAS